METSSLPLPPVVRALRAALFFVVGGLVVQSCSAAADVFANTGSLHTARSQHTATLLPNGMMLMAGGYDFGTLLSAELFDPASGMWTAGQYPEPTPDPTSTPTPTPTPVALPTLANVSTRLSVETGDNALIGGFIVTGSQPKKVIVRAIGPSLTVPNRLYNPVLELHGPGGLIASNDDWQSTQGAEIMATGVAPFDPLESAIVATLPASPTGIGYTAVMRGVNNTTGIGLVEVYDIDRTVDSKLANISTRGFVQTGDDVMIGGVIALGTGSRTVIVRAIGPSLVNTVPPVMGALADPTLELYDSNGTLLAMNDNWRDTQEAEIIATGVPPTNGLESAIVATLPASTTGVGYTAIVRGANGSTGVALVEFYALAH